MTITSNDRRKIYNGNGVSDSFNGPRAFEASDISVFLVDADGAATQVSSGDYTITGLGRPQTRIVMNTPPDEGERLLILRTVPVDQPTDITNQGAFLPEIHEDAFDRMVMQSQQLDDQVSRTFRLAETSVANVDFTVPEPEALALLGWDPMAARLINNPPDQFVTTATAGVPFSVPVTAGQTSVTVSTLKTPWSAQGVFYNGIFQAPTAYTRNGTSITFTEPLPADGEVVIIAVFGGPTNVTESDMLTYQRVATGAVTRPVRSKLDDILSVKDFGATGDGVTDDTATLQATIDEAYRLGREIYIPAGRYRITAPLVLDLRGVTGAPNTNRRRVNWRGEGKGNTVIVPNTNGITAITIRGDNPLTTGSHAYFSITGISFGGNSPTPRTCNGLALVDLAYLTVRDCSFHNLAAGMSLTGCLSSTFDSLIFNESTKGVVASAGASGPHSNIWIGCEFRSLTELGYDGYTALSGATFLNCRFEACGTAGNANTGGFRQVSSGSAGEHGVSFINCYIEGNRGGFDVSLTELGPQRVSLNAAGCCFNRVHSTNFVTNNIVTSGDVDLNLSGCTFTSYNTYVPDVSRPYLKLSATTRFRDLGNRWEDAVEAPTLSQSLPYAGFVSGSLGAAVTGVLPNGWTVSQVSTGLFRVTHNLGHTDYAVNATVASANNRVVERCIRESNSFQVKVTNVANANTDDDFSFMLNVLKPNR